MTITRRIIISAPPVVRARTIVGELLVSAFSRVAEEAVNEPPETVQSVVEVTIPKAVAPLPAPGAVATPDFYDIIDDGTTPTEGYVVSYECLYENGVFTVTQDLFGPGDFPHNYGGWPMPGEPYPPA